MLTDRLGLAALALLVSVPYLLPWHTTPIPAFYSEWWALALGLAAGLALLAARSLPLTGATLLGLALAGIAWLQAISGLATLPQLASLYGLYLLWAALLASTSRFLADRIGQAGLFRLLAWAILIGAVMAALLSLLQPWLASFGWPGYPVHQGGPIGQVNHLTSYIWIGLASGLYLHAAKKLSRHGFWAAAILLTLVVVMAGQRSSFLYAAVLIGIALWQARQTGATVALDMRRLALNLGLLFIVMHPVAMMMPRWGGMESVPPPAMRTAQQLEGPSVRLQLWRVGLEGIAAAPLLGNGVGAYPGLALTHAETISIGENPGPTESAHNVLIDLGVEFGLPVALLVMLAALYWLWRVMQSGVSAESGWAISVFAILGLHALIEYPLSYAYFLGLLAVVAGAFGRHRQVGQRLTPVALTLGLVIWGGLALAEVKRDYRLLEFALGAGKQPERLAQAQTALMRIPPSSLLSPWVATTACASLDPLKVSIGDGLAVCRIAMKFAPTVESGVNTVVLQWREGDVDGARVALHRLRLATAFQPGGADARLAGLAFRDERLAVLRR